VRVASLSYAHHVLTPHPSLGYFGASVLSTVFLTTWQGFRVGSARKAAGVNYPQSAPSARPHRRAAR
jgi:hypothetical protein